MQEIESSEEQKALVELQKRRIAELQIRQLLKTVLDSSALERIMNIKAANPDLYYQLASLLAYLYQNKQIQGKVSEQQLIQLISRVVGKKRETKITRLNK